MAKLVQMIVVLTGISLVSGLALGGLNALTKDDIENNILKFKKIPAVIDICEGFLGKLGDADKAKLEKELLENRKELEYKVKEGGEEVTKKALLFLTRKDGKPYSVVLENEGQGFGGAVGVMVGINLDSGDLTGIGVTTHSETPGVGSRIAEEAFKTQFRNMSADSAFKLKKNGGDIDAVTGATVSSGAVEEALGKTVKFYKEYRKQITETLQK